MIYLDANATTPLDPAVLEAMLPWLREQFANPSSAHRGARLAAKAIATARSQVASLLGAQDEEIVFTSGGTEANNMAIESARSLDPRRKHLVIAATEHPAVIEPARRWQALGGSVTRVPVSGEGLVNLEALRAACRPGETALVSVMWANNETGVIAPMEATTAIAHEAGALCHSDAVQAVGKLPLDLRRVPVDMLSLSAHKFHGPKGVGALFISQRARFAPLLLGGGQEKGRRSGTENVPGIIGLGMAAALAEEALSAQAETRVRELRDGFEARLCAALPEMLINGHREQRLGTTASLTFPGLDAAGLLILLDERGLACSAGSACHSAAVHPSPVLEAMGLSARHAASTLRFSFSRLNTAAEAEAAAELVIAAVTKLKSMQDDSPVVG